MIVSYQICYFALFFHGHPPTPQEADCETNILTKNHITKPAGLEVIKLEFILRLKIKRNDWLFADTCPQAANYGALF